MYDDIDLEDIECRLYSQVYHSNVEDENTDVPPESNITPCAHNKAQSNRYFSKGHTSNQSVFISFEEGNRDNSDKSYSTVHNNISVTPNTTEIVAESNHFQNNITVNQYTLPVLINPELTEALRPATFFVPWPTQNNPPSEKKKKKGKKINKRGRRRLKAFLEGRIPKATKIYNTRSQTHKDTNCIVFISDDSDDECVIVNEKCKETVICPATYMIPRPSQNLGSESEDDIIYIPPPPVEVINIDVDNEDEVAEPAPEISTDIVDTDNNKSNCQSNGVIEPSNTSNDFLENAVVESDASKFNFSLHGSDFNNTGDFLRPANPVEYCETESSCSTNDFNKENSSVKTIVFNEVDFPREDIFSDKNLEGFSTYITPKRNSCKESKEVSESPKSSKTVHEISFSGSESDGESSGNVNKNTKVGDEFNRRLPTLSPMLQCDTSNTKSVKKSSCANISQTAFNSKNDSGKRKSVIKDSEESSNTDEEERKLIRKSLKKKKKTSTKKANSLQEANIESHKSSESNRDDAIETVESGVSGKRAKKKTRNSIDRVPNNDEEQEKCDGSSDNLNDTSRQESLKSTNENTANISNTSRKKKRKKKKSVSSENTANEININELNQSWIGISDIANTEDERSNSKDNCPSDDNKQTSLVVTDQPQETQSENQIDSSNTVPEAVAQDPGESSTETINKTLPNHVLADAKCSEEIIVIDGTVSHKPNTNADNCFEILESSESEYDFQELGDVGQDMQLANCSVSFGFKSKNLCEDYSKFNVEEIQNTQSDDPKAWKILSRDQFLYLNPSHSKGPRCNRCRQFGHTAVRCTEKPDLPKCTLCGFPGHHEPRCPNKRCTQCGNEGEYSTTYCWRCIKFRNSICRICNMKGHIAKDCPDLWRRYHLTTEEGPIVVSQEPQLKPRDQLWCSGCASQGHLEHECNYYNREYPPTNPYIISYEDVLRGQNRHATPSPPPPPVWETPRPNNYYGNVATFPNFPSTSRAIPYNTPIFIPPLIPTFNQIYPVPAVIGQPEIVSPNNAVHFNPNFVPATTKVLNPFSVLAREENNATQNVVLDQMMLDYVKHDSDVNFLRHDGERGSTVQPHHVKNGGNEWMKNGQRKVKQIIMSMPSHDVKQFLTKELDELENVVSRSDPKYLRKKLFKYDRILHSKKAVDCGLVKEKNFWYRILNMFIFGVHQLRDGKVHMNYIKKYLLEPKQYRIDGHKRKSLLNAYNYIFDATRHVNINYYRVIQQLIKKSKEKH